MSLANSCSMEENTPDDVDRTSMEYRVLMAYAQRRLPASKYGQLLEEMGQEGSSIHSEDRKHGSPSGVSPGAQEQSSTKKIQKKKKKKKKSKWKRLLFPSCLRAQTGEESRQLSSERDAVNGRALISLGGVGSEPDFSHESSQDASLVTVVADRLAKIVDNSRSVEGRGLRTVVSIEEDGGQASTSVCEEDEKDNEEKIIETIVALLRKSGDELQKEMQKDNTFSQHVSNRMSYTFFRRVADQFLEEAPVRSTTDSDQVQSTKVAFAMEVTAGLTAMAKHPMNIVLGFGTRYLKENFSSWVYGQGGWGNALGVPDHEEVE